MDIFQSTDQLVNACIERTILTEDEENDEKHVYLIWSPPWGIVEHLQHWHQLQKFPSNQ